MTQFLLDTTALSELTQPYPNEGFLQWLSANTAVQTFIGVPSIGEIEIGIALLESSKKRRMLEEWLQKLIADFNDRILSFDVMSARAWGRAVASARKRGLTLSATDSQIAAIASVRGLTVVTRNVRHFEVAAFNDLLVVNPWSQKER